MTIYDQHELHRKKVELPSNFIPLKAEKFDPEVWGPHYWFFLETLSHTYPPTPNAVTKRKYYDFISNLPLFIPNPEIGDKFSQLLDRFPVSPYLDSRDSFIRWVHFAHNKINATLGKEEISLFEALELYRKQYQTKSMVQVDRFRIHKHYVYLAFALIGIILAYMFY